MQSLSEQIAQLRKDDWVNLQGLIDSAKDCLTQNNPNNECTSISLLGKGGFHYVYKLVFKDGTQLAASVSRQDDEDFNPQAKQSEVETMKFVRESGIYPDIPVPKIHKYDTTFSNPAGAPYVLMDVVEGEILSDLQDGQRCGLDALPHTQKRAVVKALAKLKASLCRPIPFDRIGSLVKQTNDENLSVGPLITISGRCIGGPFSSTHEMWKHFLDQEIEHAVQEWSFNVENEVRSTILEPSCTPHTFTELYQLLSALVPEFKIPEPYHLLALHHPDIALRNVFFDRESLSSEEALITGVIDWGGSQILPLMLTAQYPADLITEAGRPIVLFGRTDEGWSSVPADWTRLGDKSKWPAYVSTRGEPTDWTAYISDNIKKFYLRAYFAACFGDDISSTRGDATMAHRTLFMDAEFYMKFHEALSGGWDSWVMHADWIRETHARLKNLSKSGIREGHSLVIGPNLYTATVRQNHRDLRTFESDSPTKDDNDV